MRLSELFFLFQALIIHIHIMIMRTFQHTHALYTHYDTNRLPQEAHKLVQYPPPPPLAAAQAWHKLAPSG